MIGTLRGLLPSRPDGLGRLAWEAELPGQGGPAQDAGELSGLRSLGQV